MSFRRQRVYDSQAECKMGPRVFTSNPCLNYRKIFKDREHTVPLEALASIVQLWNFSVKVTCHRE